MENFRLSVMTVGFGVQLLQLVCILEINATKHNGLICFGLTLIFWIMVQFMKIVINTKTNKGQPPDVFIHKGGINVGCKNGNWINNNLTMLCPHKCWIKSRPIHHHHLICVIDDMQLIAAVVGGGQNTIPFAPQLN